MNRLVLMFALSSAAQVHASVLTEDLSLEGERWLGRATSYVCAENPAVPVAAPESLAKLQLRFESMSTDYTLDNGLIKASFVVGEHTCRYSALLLADNALKTIALVESRAFSQTADDVCKEGQSLIDQAIDGTRYLYWGRPHHVTILANVSEAEALCGAGSTQVGIDFVLSGRVN